jgi:hypothetical protein
VTAEQRHGSNIRLDTRSSATVGPGDDQDARWFHAL